MANYNSGTVNVGTPGSQTALSLSNASRRLYDFSDRVADLAPDESPFFVYLSKVAKVPTSDPYFRFLEDRTKIAITDRSFTVSTDATATAVGGTETWTISSSPWVIAGMVAMAASNDSDGAPNHPTFKITSVTNATTIVIEWLTEPSASDLDGSTTAFTCQVIGTSFQEGTGAPDVWSQELDHGFGYTQIFKTACELSNTARATVYRGYADEWQRIWNLKLREHKVDIERAMLFGQASSADGIQNTAGIVGSILANSTPVVADGTALAYSEDAAYYRSVDSMTYDMFLKDLEVVFDPARGGSSSKLALASLPVITMFNKLGDGAFIDASLGHSANPYAYNFDSKEGAFGHKVMKIDTVHGDISLVKEPLFRGIASKYLALVDLDQVAYRPLIGNGVNRDTHITTNVQSPDVDSRKDMILTEAGLEVSLPETHALFNIEQA
jgi:hypothetical protein